jgi:hypothetical protein
MKKALAITCLFLATALVCFVAYVNFDAITGAFGDGPPYFGRTTNMDKWTNPLPVLLAIDALALGVFYFALKWALRTVRSAF